MNREKFIENILFILPYWHYKVDKPFKNSIKDKMSLESYYCLQTIRRVGAMNMSEIARRVSISKQQATKIIDRLEKHGFVNRVHSVEDRRAINIEITPRAEEYIDKNYYNNVEFISLLEGKLTADEMERFDEAIGILADIFPKLDNK